MRDLPSTVRLYLWGAMLLGILALGLQFPVLTHTTRSQIGIALVAALIMALTSVYRVPISDDKAITVTVGISFATILLLGPALAAWTTAVGVILGSVYLSAYRKRWKWYTGTFNTSAYVLSVAAASVIYFQISPAETDLVSWASVAALSIAAVVYFTVNSILVAGIVALRRNLKAWSCWVSILQETVTQYFALIFLGIITAAVYQYAPWTLPLLIIPLFAIYQLLRKHRETSTTSSV